MASGINWMNRLNAWQTHSKDMDHADPKCPYCPNFQGEPSGTQYPLADQFPLKAGFMDQDDEIRDIMSKDELTAEDLSRIEQISGNINIFRATSEDVDSFNLPSALAEDAGDLSTAGFAAGFVNSGVMDAFNQNNVIDASQGRGPSGYGFNATVTAQRTAENNKTITAVGSAALGIGGSFGPEGLAAGAVIAGGLDIMEGMGLFNSSDLVNSTNGNAVSPSSTIDTPDPSGNPYAATGEVDPSQ